jgi:hypothetical protein
MAGYGRRWEPGAEATGTVPIADRSFHFGGSAHRDFVAMTSVDDATALARWWDICATRVAPTEADHYQSVAQAAWWASIAETSQAVAAAELGSETEQWLARDQTDGHDAGDADCA